MSSRIYTSDGEIPFEVGKTYLIRGNYFDYEVRAEYEIMTDQAGNQEFTVTGRIRDDFFTPRWIMMDPESPMLKPYSNSEGILAGWDNWIVEQKIEPETGKLYWCRPDDNCWPYYSEYTGSWETYLQTTEGAVWKEEIIPYFERNHCSVPVILTDNVETMYTFHSGDGTIMDGEFFCNEDYKNGSPVCMISVDYAQINDLSIGDTIHLEFYNAGYTQTSYPVLQGTGRKGLTIQRYELRDETRIGYEQDYTIVGIYAAPKWEAGSQSFHADTIFIPKASVPESNSYSGPSLTLLNTIIIENGSVEAFEAHLATNGYAGAYQYFDQGYSEAVNTIQTLIENARRIMSVGIFVFILSSLLFLLLYTRRTAPVIRTMRLLGVSAKKAWRECFASLIWQEVIAVLIGNALAIILYNRITQMVLNSSLELLFGSVISCGVLQFLVLFVAGIIWTRSVANRNLMQKR